MPMRGKSRGRRQPQDTRSVVQGLERHSSGGSRGAIRPSVERAILLAILTVAACACLWNLGAPRLWQDEAETALLGRNILKFGVPRVWDGQNLVAQFYALDFDRHLLFQKSWLPPYLVAASFAVFGESTAAARFPFALASVLTVWLTWRIARRLSGSPLTALTSAGLLSVSLPFVLYGRQCRWYGVAMALSLLLIETEDNLERPMARVPWLFFGVSIAALYHTNYLISVATAGGVIVARAMTRGWRSLVARRFVLGMVVASSLVLPHAIAFPALGEAINGGGPAAYFASVGWVVGDLNRYLLPVPGLVILLVVAARQMLRDGWVQRLAIVLTVAILTSSLTMWSGLVTIIGFRYVVNLLPFAAVLTASVFTQALGSRPAFLAGLLVLHLATHVVGFPLSMWPPAGRPGLARADLLDGWRAVVHPVRGPIDAAVEFLETNAKAGEYLHTPYEALPIQFYTELRTSGMQTVGARLAELGVTLPAYVSEVQPDRLDWLLPRRPWEKFQNAPGTPELIEAERILGREGRVSTLDAPDLPWQNREYPAMRVFVDDPTIPRTIIVQFPSKAVASPR
jgi:4-amino-4-deoxy-L-arabinose transferase-like glycosyltransferase